MRKYYNRYYWHTLSYAYYRVVFLKNLKNEIKVNGLLGFIISFKKAMDRVSLQTFYDCLVEDIKGKTCGITRYKNNEGREFPRRFKPSKHFLDSHYRNLRQTMGEETFKRYMEWSKKEDRSLEELGVILG